MVTHTKSLSTERGKGQDADEIKMISKELYDPLLDYKITGGETKTIQGRKTLFIEGKDTSVHLDGPPPERAITAWVNLSSANGSFETVSYYAPLNTNDYEKYQDKVMAAIETAQYNRVHSEQ